MKEQEIDNMRLGNLAIPSIESFNLPDIHPSEIDTANSPPAESMTVDDNKTRSEKGNLVVRISLKKMQRYKILQELQKRHEKNKKLQKKLNKTLEWVKGLTTQYNSYKYSIEDTKIQLLRRKGNQSEANYMSRTVLLGVRKWVPDDSLLVCKFLSALENYKAYVKCVVDRYKGNDMEIIISKAKRHAYNSNKVDKRKAKFAKVPLIRDNDVKASKIWGKMNCYFSLNSIGMINELIELEEMELSFPQILNMYAVNRISAITKMMQYCKDNNMELKRFQEGRILQKIRGWHKMAKITAVAYNSGMARNEESKINYIDKKGLCYPLIDELDYLLSLNADKLPEEVTRLKGLLFAYNNGYIKSEKECELREVVVKNKQRIKKILNRINSERVKEGRTMPTIKRKFIRKIHRTDLTITNHIRNSKKEIKRKNNPKKANEKNAK